MAGALIQSLEAIEALIATTPRYKGTAASAAMDVMLA